MSFLETNILYYLTTIDYYNVSVLFQMVSCTCCCERFEESKIKRIHTTYWLENPGKAIASKVISVSFPVTQYTISTEFRIYIKILRRCCKHICCCCIKCKVYSTKTTVFDYFCTAGSYGNRVLKGLLRFLLVLASVALLTHFLKNKLKLSLSEIWVYLIGILVGLGVTFSRTIRLLMLLLAPQIFTQNVRFALITNAAYVALKGPGKNFRYNLDALIEGLHKCKVDLENSLRDAMHLLLAPLEIVAEFFLSIKSVVEAALRKLREAIEIVQSSLSFMETIFHDASDWLREIGELCNFHLGTPYNRCKKGFAEAVTGCTETVGHYMSFMCNLDVLDGLCEVVSSTKSICPVPSTIDESLLSRIRIVLQEIYDAWAEFFDARIYNVTVVPPKSKMTFSKNITLFETLKQELFASFDFVLRWPITLQDILTLGIAVVMMWSSAYYLYWYLHSDQHDNQYITDGMVRMDLHRRMLGKPGIFPLNPAESKEYVQVWSLRRLKSEKTKFRRQVFMVSTSSIPTIIYVFIDLILYSLLLLIQHLGEYVNTVQVSSNITGLGGFNHTEDATENPLPKLSKRIKSLLEFDLSDCVPTPLVPNFLLDAIIGLLLLFCIVSTAFEAHGLRLRHVICGHYYPERQISRDRWLYTHILNSRGSFFKYAKTHVLAKLTGDDNDNVFRVGCVQRFIHKCPGGRKLCTLLSINQKQCFLCGKSGGIDDYDEFQSCPECKAVYCNDCFHHLKRECPVCSIHIAYDLEIDEESGSTDSSEDNQNSKPRRIMKMYRQIRARKLSDAVSSKKTNEGSNSQSLPPTSTTEEDNVSDADGEDQFQKRRSNRRRLFQRNSLGQSTNSSSKKLSSDLQTYSHDGSNANQVSSKRKKKLHLDGNISGEKSVQTSTHGRNQGYIHHEGSLSSGRLTDFTQVTDDSTYFPYDNSENGGLLRPDDNASKPLRMKSDETSSHGRNQEYSDGAEASLTRGRDLPQFTLSDESNHYFPYDNPEKGSVLQPGDESSEQMDFKSLNSRHRRKQEYSDGAEALLARGRLADLPQFTLSDESNHYFPYDNPEKGSVLQPSDESSEQMHFKSLTSHQHRRKQEYSDIHQASMASERSLVSSDRSNYFPDANSGRGRNSHPGDSSSVHSRVKSYATANFPSTDPKVKEKLNNFWNVPSIGPTSSTGWEGTSEENSELNPARLTDQQFEETVYSTYNSVLSDLSSSYKQFQVLSSEDLISGIDSHSSYGSARSGMTSIEQDSKGINYGHNEVHTHQRRLRDSLTKTAHGVSDYDYKRCIPTEENPIDERLKMLYGKVLLELTSDFPQFDMRSESSEFHLN